MRVSQAGKYFDDLLQLSYGWVARNNEESFCVVTIKASERSTHGSGDGRVFVEVFSLSGSGKGAKRKEL